jgi:hypothetical protein
VGGVVGVETLGGGEWWWRENDENTAVA